MKLVFSGLLSVLAAAGAIAQPPQPQPSTAPAAPAPARAGAGALPFLPTMQLSSSAWHDNGSIPVKYSQAGHDVSPPLEWSHVPEGTESFVILVHDLDVATSKGDNLVLSWMVWNIPKTKSALPEGLPEGGEMGEGMRQISDSGPYYRGPAAPNSDPPHHYAFEIYALSAVLNVPAVIGGSATPVRTAVEEAMAGKVLAKGVLIGTFQRP
jgi:Raf kinase inhibitor-like YbhB/YbcL family protein